MHIFVVFGLLLVSLSACSSRPVATPAFESVGLQSDLTQDQAQMLAVLRAAPTNASVRVVRFRPGWFRSDALDFKLASVDRVFERSGDALVEGAREWSGAAVQGEGWEDVVLTYRGADCTGSIRSQQGVFLIRPLGGGLHAVVELDHKKTPPDHPKGGEPGGSGPRKDIMPSAAATPRAASTITALVLYTPKVKKIYKARIGGLVDSAIASANRSFQKSKIAARIVEAHSAEIAYRESGDHARDTSRLEAKADGYMDDAHTLRDFYKADVVVLLVDDGSACGYAAEIGAKEDEAFAVVHHGCADGYLSFAHEIGHLMGARHNPEADSTPGYNHGYYKQRKQWRTVMSYDCPGGCTRVAHWSNPGVKYNGDSTGTKARHDNARMLNATRARVASFR